MHSSEGLRNDLIGIAHRSGGLREFSLGAARSLRRAVPFDAICLLSFDPATLMPTGEVVLNGLPPEATPRLAEIEVGETDFNKFRALPHEGLPTATLSHATGGDLDRSLRHSELRGPLGFGDELRATLVADGTAWGGMALLRERGAPHFSASESRLVASLASHLARGVRRAIVNAALTAPETEPDRGAGVLLMGEDNTVLQANDAGRAWLEELHGIEPGVTAGIVITAVATLARQAASGRSAGDASARVQTPSGRWLLVQGSVLGQGPAPETVVVLQPLGPTELGPFIAEAYGLTDRERAITQLVAQGFSTSAIGDRLYLSSWTVQDHLKSIFEKTGVGSRGELVARLFFEHHLPRLESGEAA